jgi:DNA invertase Pin-like site-specific DNA recombinase
MRANHSRNNSLQPGSKLRIVAADIHDMSSPEERLMRAVWGKTEVMYDRRQKKPRRTGWRGGRRASDWPEALGTGRQKRQAKPAKLIM